MSLRRFFVAPSTSRSTRFTATAGSVVFGLAFVAGLGAFKGPAVAVGVVVGLAAIAMAVANPWWGLVATLVATMMLPTPFSIDLGGVTLTIDRVFLFATVGGWLLQLKRPDRPFTPTRTALDSAVILFVVIAVVSMAANLGRFSDPELAGAIRRIGLAGIDWALLFFVAVSVMGSRQRRWKAVRLLAGLTVVVAALGLVERVSGQNIFQIAGPVLPGGFARFLNEIASASVLTRGAIARTRSTFEQPLIFGTVLAMGLPLVITLAATSGSRAVRQRWTGGSAIVGLALLLTLSRSVYLVAAVGVVTLLVASPRPRSRRSALVAVVLTGAMFVVQPQVRSTMVAFFDLGGDAPVTNTIDARLADYDPVFDLGAERPLLGYGPRTFAVDELLINELLDDPTNLVLDNTYLLAFAETGVIGLASMLLVLAMGWTAAWRASRRCRDPADAAMALALGVSVQAFALMGLAADVFVFRTPPKLLFVILALIATLRLDSASRSEESEAPGIGEDAPGATDPDAVRSRPRRRAPLTPDRASGRS